MKIVVNKIENDLSDYLVYLKTDDGVNVSANFANKESLQYVIEDMIDESNEEKENIMIEMPDDGISKEKPKGELPLVLVFYLDRDLMGNPQIINPFAEAVNEAIALRDANAMAFFLPTDGPERIDCINPQLATNNEKSRITKMIEEIEKSFDIGQGADKDYDDVNVINTGDNED